MSRAAKAKGAETPVSEKRPQSTPEPLPEWMQERFDDMDHVTLHLLTAVNAVEHLAGEGNAAVSIYRELRGYHDGAEEYEEVERHARAARKSLREVTDGVLRIREDLRQSLFVKGGAS